MIFSHAQGQLSLLNKPLDAEAIDYIRAFVPCDERKNETWHSVTYTCNCMQIYVVNDTVNYIAYPTKLSCNTPLPLGLKSTATIAELEKLLGAYILSTLPASSPLPYHYRYDFNYKGKTIRIESALSGAFAIPANIIFFR